MSFVCQTCGQQHDAVPLDIGFQRPADYFAVPAGERESRCKLTSDWCIIDGNRYFIRGILYVPIIDIGGHFGWGLWAEVTRPDFETYCNHYYTDGSQIPPFAGKLSGEHPGYEGLGGHAVRIRLGTRKDRPEFTVVPSEHLLYREQTRGITIHRVTEILHTVFPDDYPAP